MKHTGIKPIRPPEGLTDVKVLSIQELNQLRFPDRRTVLTPELLGRMVRSDAPASAQQS